MERARANLAATSLFTPAGTGAVVRTTQDKLRELRSILDFVPTTLHAAIAAGTDNTDLASYFTLAFAAHNNFFAPPGTYNLSSLPTAPTGAFSLAGVSGQTIFKINHVAASGALAASPGSLFNQVTFRDFVIQANHSSAPCDFGLVITYPSAASFSYRTATIEGITFTADTSSTTTPWPRTWKRGIKLTNAWYPRISGVTGISKYETGGTDNSGFLELAGGSYGSIGLQANDCVWYYGGSGVLMSAYTEAARFLSCELVGVTDGISCPSSTATGGAANAYRCDTLWFVASHIAAWRSAFDIDTAQHVYSVHSDIQRTSGSTAATWTGYKFNAVLYPAITGGKLAGNSGAGTAKGVTATGVTAHGELIGVHIENVDRQFELGASTSLWTIKLNNSTGAAADTFTIAGSNHVIEWRNADGTISTYGYSAKVTGFTTAAGTANKNASGINVGTITATDGNVQALAAWVKALHDALVTHGDIGA